MAIPVISSLLGVTGKQLVVGLYGEAFHQCDMQLWAAKSSEWKRGPLATPSAALREGMTPTFSGGVIFQLGACAYEAFWTLAWSPGVTCPLP